MYNIDIQENIYYLRRIPNVIIIMNTEILLTEGEIL